MRFNRLVWYLFQSYITLQCYKVTVYLLIYKSCTLFNVSQDVRCVSTGIEKQLLWKTIRNSKKKKNSISLKKNPESIMQTEIIGYYIDCTQILWSIDNIKYLPTYTMQSARKKSDCSQNQCDFKRVDSNDIFTITTCRFQSCLENITMHGLLNRIKLVYDPAILSHIHNSPGWTLSFHH